MAIANKVSSDDSSVLSSPSDEDQKASTARHRVSTNLQRRTYVDNVHRSREALSATRGDTQRTDPQATRRARRKDVNPSASRSKRSRDVETEIPSSTRIKRSRSSSIEILSSPPKRRSSAARHIKFCFYGAEMELGTTDKPFLSCNTMHSFFDDAKAAWVSSRGTSKQDPSFGAVSVRWDGLKRAKLVPWKNLDDFNRMMSSIEEAIDKTYGDMDIEVRCVKGG